MSIIKVLRFFPPSKNVNKISILCTPSVCTVPSLNIHKGTELCVKMFKEHENSYAYNIINKQSYGVPSHPQNDNNTLLTTEYIGKLLQEDWSKKSPKDIINIFPVLGNCCSTHNLSISNRIFDNFIDNFTDNIKMASDEELKFIFYALLQWPETESIRTRNFIEVWTALDDECLNRIRQWSYDEMLTYTALFYTLNVSKYSDFCNKCLHKLASKAKHLTVAQIVQTMFFVGIQRKPPYDMHNLEVYIDNLFHEFTLDQLAICAMGFFKSKTPIRNINLVSKIITRLTENCKSIHEISLSALLKVIRYSMKITTDDKIYFLLDKLKYEVPRLSIVCNVHVALLGTSTLTFHEGCLNEIANTIRQSMPQARIKDLERLVLTYGTFDFIPPSNKHIFNDVIEELRKPCRESEIKLYGRAFACCIAYLGLLKMYPKDLMQKVLSRDFLCAMYGKHCNAYGREILTIHNNAKIFLRDCDNINTLSDKEAILMAKKYTDFVPSEDYIKQYNVTERMFLDIITILREYYGSDCVIGDHILTHHQRGDIILCQNHSGQPLSIANTFDNRNFGLLRMPPDKNIWIVLVIAGRNAIIRNTKAPSGQFKTKIRELKSLGFNAELVLWEDLSKCETKKQKTDYLVRLIKNATKK